MTYAPKHSPRCIEWHTALRLPSLDAFRTHKEAVVSSSRAHTFRGIHSFPTLATMSLVVVAGCGRRSAPDAAEPASASPSRPGAAAEGADPSATEEPARQATPEKPALPAPIVVKDAGFASPESVLYDPEEDVYLVSNVNGPPLEVDRNGFISKVDPDGKVVALKWIDGSQKGVTLNGPKGMTFKGTLLYVADINFLRIFDRKTGRPMGKVAIAGATFANALATAPDGTIYASDSGLKAGKDGFESTGTDSIHKMGKNNLFKPLLADKTLGGPNGLWADDGGVYTVTFGSGELIRIGADGTKGTSQKLPQGGLDGLEQLPDGTLAISSWHAAAVYRGKPGGEFSVLVENVKGPADIGIDSKRNRLLIPLFQDNAVHIQPLAALPPLADPEPRKAPSATAPKEPAPAKDAKPTQTAKTVAPEEAASGPDKPAAAPAKEGSPAATPARPASPATPATPAKPGAPSPAKEAPPAAPTKK
jgi:hypothetical protein